MVGKLIVQTCVLVVYLGGLLFGSAGTLAWPAAWVFIGEMAASSLAVGLSLARHDPGLLRERLKPIVQQDQTPTDRKLMIVFGLAFCAWLVLAGLDARRFGWSSVPVWLQAVGAVAVLVCMYVIHLTFRANSFAAPVVKIQQGRGQTVISDGPYRYLRHPMYAGALLLFVGAPLLLGSWWALAGAAVMVGLLTLRIGVEEKALRVGLEGYDAYAARVRWRLVPGVW